MEEKHDIFAFCILHFALKLSPSFHYSTIPIFQYVCEGLL